MSELAEVIAEVEGAGAALRLHGGKVRIRYRKQQVRDQLAQQISFLRAHRAEVAELLRTREVIPAMPPQVKLVEWSPKEPPIAIESCAVVVDVARFVQSTLGQLERALANPKRWVGWTVPQLVDCLQQVGVLVEVEGRPDAKGRR